MNNTLTHVNTNEDGQTQLLLEHSDLVKKIAHHLLAKLPPNIQIDDLLQAGMIGLLDAAKHYDQMKGASFTTYASIRIRGAMLDEIRKGDWVPRSVHRNTRKITKAMREIENDTGRDAKDIEVAEKLNIEVNEYHQLLKDTNNCRLIGFDDIGMSEEFISEGLFSNIPEPFEGIQKEDFKKMLTKAVKKLSKREQLVLSLYYDEELNLKEIGAVIGVSESRVCQINSQAMTHLRTRLSEWHGM